jgi:hypothetical protein
MNVGDEAFFIFAVVFIGEFGVKSKHFYILG